MARWQCPACGSPLSQGQRYCASCGTFLTSDAGADPRPDTAEVHYYPDGQPYPGPAAAPEADTGASAPYGQSFDHPQGGGYVDPSYGDNVQYPQGDYAQPEGGYTEYGQHQYGQAQQYPESSPYHFAQPQPDAQSGGYYPATGPVYPPTGPVPAGGSRDETWKRRMQAIVGITAILFLAAGTVVGIIYLRSGSDGPTAGAAASQSTDATSAADSSATAGPGSTPPAQSTEPPVTTTEKPPTTPAPPPTTAAPTTVAPTSPPPPNFSDPNWPLKSNDQADVRGWLASKWTRCPSDQAAVLLMQTPRFKITVCSASGALTYHGWKIGAADGIVIAGTQFDGTTYTSVNKGTTYIVGHNGLQVVQNGKTLVQEPATVRWPS